MNRQEVITILDTLADGVDPATGQRIPYEAFHTATAVRALFAASAFLKSDTGRAPRSKTFTAAGAPWSAEEDARLGQEFDAGLTVAQIALQHGRTSGAITSRLVKIGRLDPEKVKARERGGRVTS
jgi:hypothetical protein